MAQRPNKSRGLGRGLSALMSDVGEAPQNTPRRAETHVPVEKVHPNPDQPRRAFEESALEDLANSIAEKGIIQPLIVRSHPSRTGDYEIVAGERRWRAAQRAKLHEVPVIVRSFDDTEVLEVAIIENIQRADLNPVDEATGYRQLMDKFGHTQEQMSTALGKSRSHIANLLRLLNLPADVQTFLSNGDLSAGHARALVGHPNASILAQEVLRKGLSVRETERLAKKETTPGTTTPAKPKIKKDADTLQIEGELSATLGMKATIDHAPTGEGGNLVLHYRDLDQLDDLLRALAG